MSRFSEVARLVPRDAEGVAELGAAASADTSTIEASGMKAAVIDGEHLVVFAVPKGIVIVPRNMTVRAFHDLANSL